MTSNNEKSTTPTSNNKTLSYSVNDEGSGFDQETSVEEKTRLMTYLAMDYPELMSTVMSKFIKKGINSLDDEGKEQPPLPYAV